MGLVVTVTAGLILWIVLWALGSKGFDAFLLTALIILLGGRRADPVPLPSRPANVASDPSRVLAARPQAGGAGSAPG